jgi:hypothetical protein
VVIKGLIVLYCYQQTTQPFRIEAAMYANRYGASKTKTNTNSTLVRIMVATVAIKTKSLQ